MAYWAERLGVSRARILEAVDLVGCDVERVKQALSPESKFHPRGAVLAESSVLGYDQKMQPTLAQLDADLDRFQSELEAKVAANPDDTDLEGDADLMIRAMQSVAGPHKGHVQERITCILGTLGLIPSDNEGESCS